MNDKPIFLQLTEMIEDNILSGVWGAGELIISSTQICRLYNVNPATAMRALTELSNDGIVVKDRGIGMRLTEQAKSIVLNRRKRALFDETLTGLVREAKKLGVTKELLTQELEKEYEEEKND